MNNVILQFLKQKMNENTFLINMYIGKYTKILFVTFKLKIFTKNYS